jgi:hypothetical protein
MKIIFSTLLVGFFSLSALGQTTTALPTTNSTAQMNSGHDITRWKENLRISYLGEAIGPNMHRWDDNQYDKDGKKLPTPASLWNNFGFRYKILQNTSLIASPRFYTQFGDRNDLNTKKEDPHVFAMDDFAYSVAQQIFKSPTLSYGMRLTHRNPDSVNSRVNNIRSQLEFQNDIVWLASPAFSVIHWNGFRNYFYNSEGTEIRYRLNFTTIFNYNFNDKWKVQLMHEWDMQHRNPKSGPLKKDWNYFAQYKDTLALGVGYNVTPKWSVIPFAKLLNDEDIQSKTTQLGVWVIGTIF